MGVINGELTCFSSIFLPKTKAYKIFLVLSQQIYKFASVASLKKIIAALTIIHM
jgi:hypothetical protein